jgi:AcrR family transcriptional regulator
MNVKRSPKDGRGRGRVREWKRAQVLGTRAHLLETAAGMFGDRGYAGTPLEEVVSSAGLTRGALYHHFKDKRALFDSVVDQVLRTVVEEVESQTVKRALERGQERESDAVELFVESLRGGARHRILCVDGPSVLGRERWSELMWSRLLDPVRRVVAKGAERGTIAPELVPAVTHLLFGAVQEAALLASHDRAAVKGVNAEQPPIDRAEVDAGLEWLLDRFLGEARA